MSVSSLALNSTWRDYWGMWNPLVECFLAPLELSECHAPRFVVLPQLNLQTLPASGYMQYNFHLVPGSLIWGMFPTNNSQIAVQLTDVGLAHAFFQEPISADQLATAQAGAYFPAATLINPHPVTGDGLFTFEAWGPAGAVFVMLLGVAEVTDCPVR